MRHTVMRMTAQMLPTEREEARPEGAEGHPFSNPWA